MAPHSVFVDVSMMHVITKIGSVWQQITKEQVTKPILANLGTRIFKNFSLLQTVEVSPGETNISELLTAHFIFISLLLHSPHPLKVRSFNFSQARDSNFQKNFLRCKTVLVSPGETNISELFTVHFIFVSLLTHSPHPLKVRSLALTVIVHPTFTCSKSTMETQKQCDKSARS